MFKHFLYSSQNVGERIRFNAKVCPLGMIREVMTEDEDGYYDSYGAAMEMFIADHPGYDSLSLTGLEVRLLGGLPGIKIINLADTLIPRLRFFDDVETIFLSGTPVRKIGSLREMKNLYLDRMPHPVNFTGSYAATKVDVSHSRVVDMSGLENVKYLDLSHAVIPTDGLQYLQNVIRLSIVGARYIDGSPVLPSHVIDALPSLRVLKTSEAGGFRRVGTQ